ncbi:hypothetical protein DYB28_005662 [Aphanomyces astaci]|nr:hypothetical protein DYB34_001949 [Aphanomyces astaci]RHZ10431.1 hypothetical protein DYB31_001431 [Aphanomyces astaci]RHZ13102.1 hypothetical protein DYB26_008377 [Aphanomyces astaci]RLO11075.1 hypothetical protein DYB28_005662 [Aphanomyces astaci]
MLAPLDSTPEANPPDHVKPALLPSQRVAWVLLQDAIWWPVLVCGSFFQDENADKCGHLVEAVHLYYFGTHT